MGRAVPVHYLRPNEAEWSPPLVAFFDVETTPVPAGDDEVHVMRLWCARLDRRRPEGQSKAATEWGRGHTPADLLAWFESATVGGRSIWVYAHNLSFDLTASGIVGQLIGAGWSVSEFSVSGEAPWFRFAKGSKRLLFTDSWSWLRQPLERVGRAVNIVKPPLPDDDDTDAAWFHRCRADVDILATAVLDLMAWWDRDHLGRWSITGSATGWNALRHRMRPKAVVIDPDDEARAFERQAIRGGRRDAWRWGTFEAGPYLEIDFRAAHPSIVAGCLMPCRRGAAFESLSLDDPIWSQRTRGVIAEAIVTTTEPRYPVRIGHQNFYPTGTFRTTLAGPELDLARERDELVSVGRGRIYRLDGHLQEWAHWVLTLAAGQLPGAPKVAALAGRHWSRSAIGHWAMRGSTVVPLGPALHPVWHVEDGYDVAAASPAQMVDVGGRRWWVIHDQETDNSFPAVWAWVESELRARLARVIDTIGAELVLTCDTDGLIVDATKLFTPAHRRRLKLARCHNPRTAVQSLCRRLQRLTDPLELRLKGGYDHMSVLGPQQMELDQARRLSGIRADAERDEEGRYVAHTWPNLRWQMTHGDPRGYVRPLVRAKVEGPYIARWYLADGSLFAPQATMDEDGRTVLVPYSELSPRPPFDLRAEVQHPVIMKETA